MRASSHTLALSGLQSIVEGHAVIMPRDAVERTADLSEMAFLDFWHTILITQAEVEMQCNASASNLAVSDGKEAGAPVAHLLAHVLPRKPGDFERNDQIYDLLSSWEPAPGARESPLPDEDWPDDAVRHKRTEEDMASEARIYLTASLDLASSKLPLKHNFGGHHVPGSTIFYASPSGMTVAFVNLKPLKPGHVLVTPVRCMPRLKDLTEDEFRDLFLSVRQVQTILEQHYCAGASKIGIQDGIVAGQSVPHVHVHVIPFPVKKIQ